MCKEFGLIDNPVHSVCIDGNRFIPVKLIDVAGLVPGAYTGRGLGNKFLDDARQTNVLIHVVDASGFTTPRVKLFRREWEILCQTLNLLIKNSTCGYFHFNERMEKSTKR